MPRYGKQSISYQRSHDKTRSRLFKGIVIVCAIAYGKVQLWLTVKDGRVCRIRNTWLLCKLENAKNFGSHSQLPVISV